MRRRERGEIRRSSLGWRGKLQPAATKTLGRALLLNHVLDVKCVIHDFVNVVLHMTSQT